MARKRVKVDTSRLRSMGDITQVIARPVDTYVTPQRLPSSTRSEQIVNALKSINPSVQDFLKGEFQDLKEEEAEKGEKSFYTASPEERKKWKKAIQDGTIAEVQSPFWVEGYARSLLTNQFKDYAQKVMVKYEETRHEAGFNLDSFLVESRKKYMEDNNLDGYRADLLNDEFISRTNALDQQIGQREYERKITEVKQNKQDLLLGQFEGALELAVDADNLLVRGDDGKLVEGQLNVKSAIEEINKQVQTHIDQGADAAETLRVAENYLMGQIRQLAREGGDWEAAWQVLGGLKNKGGDYKDNRANEHQSLYTQMETLAEKARTDAYAREVEEDNAEAFQLRKKLIESMQKDGFKGSWWEDNAEDLKRLRVLSQSDYNDVGAAFKNKGQLPVMTDQRVVTTIQEQIRKGTQTADEINKTIDQEEKAGNLTPTDADSLRALNNGQGKLLLDKLHIGDVVARIDQDIMNTKDGDINMSTVNGMLGINASKDYARSTAALKARNELGSFITDQAAKVANGTISESEALKNITEEYDKIKEKYLSEYLGVGNKNGGANNSNNSTSNPTGTGSGADGSAVVVGKSTPWFEEDGKTPSVSPKTLAGDLRHYLETATNPDKADSRWETSLGKMIKPLVDAGEDEMAVLKRMFKDITGQEYRSEESLDPSGVEDGRPTNADGSKAPFDPALVNYDMTTVMQQTGTFVTAVLPQDFVVSEVHEITTGGTPDQKWQNGTFNGMYYYKGTLNGMPYVAISPMKPKQETVSDTASGTVSTVPPSDTARDDRVKKLNAATSGTVQDLSAGSVEDRSLDITDLLQLQPYIGPDNQQLITDSINLLIGDEGFSAIPYPDRTTTSVGYGFSIKNLTPDERAMIKDINNVTEPEAKKVIEVKVGKLIDKLAREIPNWNTLKPARQQALIAMGYQLGVENILNQGPDKGKQWPSFISEVIQGAQSSGTKRESHFQKAAQHMLWNFGQNGKKSKTGWYRQTPKRAIDMQRLIRGY